MDCRSNEKQRGRRLVSLLLSLVMTVQLLPALVTEADAAELSVSVTQDGRAVEQLTISQAENAAVEAACTVEGAGLQWQILTEEGWVDIYGADSAALTVSYALVREVLDVVLSLAKAGSTMVIVTHEMNFARAIADRILFIENGAVVEQSDDPKAFFASPKTDRAKAFLKSFDYDE